MKQLLTVVGVILVAAMPALASPQSGPSIKFDSVTREIGKVIDGEIIHQVFKYTNKGDATLEITSVNPSCGCTTADPVPRTIAPGESGQITVQITTADQASQSKSLSDTFPLSKTITVNTNDAKQPQTVLTVNFTVAPEIVISDPSVYFGSNPSGREVTKEILVQIAPDRPVKVLNVASTDEYVTASLEPVAGSNNKRYKIIAVQSPKAPEGLHFGNLIIQTSSSLKPEVRLTVRGIVTKGD